MSPHETGPGTGAPRPSRPAGAAVPRLSPPKNPAAKPSRWWGVTGGVLFGLLALGIVWYTTHDANERVSATTTSYEVRSDTSVEVQFDVTRPPTQKVTCTVTAQDEHFTAVGSVQVVIPTGAEGSARTVHQVATVRTATRAVTGNVTDCVRT